MNLYNICISYLADSGQHQKAFDVVASDAQTAIVEVLSNQNHEAHGAVLEVRVGIRNSIVIKEHR